MFGKSDFVIFTIIDDWNPIIDPENKKCQNNSSFFDWGDFPFKQLGFDLKCPFCFFLGI